MRTARLKTILLVLIHLAAIAQPGVLKKGKWLKLGVRENGIYQIDFNMFSRIADPLVINPTQIKLFAYPTGMLPQANNIERTKGLQEVAIRLMGMEDGKFNKGDRILFYGEGSDKISYIKSKDVFKIENNIYDDRNYYFLTVSEDAGKRIPQVPAPSGLAIELSTHTDYFYSEVDRVNILKSGRDWFGIDFDANTEATINLEMDGIVEGSSARLISRLMAESYQNASFRIDVNGTAIGDFPIAAIPQTSYGVKGRTRNDTTSFIFRGTSDQQTIKIIYDRGGNNYSIGRLDYLIGVVKRKLSWSGVPKIFFNTDARQQPNEMVISSEKEAAVWEITDPFLITEQQTRFQNNSIRFVTTGEVVKKYILFPSSGPFLKPVSATVIRNQDLSSLPPSDMIIVTHPEFLEEAKRLASHRTTSSGVLSTVVTTEEIYHEYSGGRQDPTAIRDFLRTQFKSPGSKLKYALLFGKGTYDYRNITGTKTTWVPIYQSVNSLSPLETYASDDYYGFLEDQEGTWNESPSQFHTLDIGIGRIPCISREQAKDLVDKLISYDLSPETSGAWKRTITFVADDGDGNIHQSQANQLAGWIEQKRPDLLAERLFLDLFPQTTRPFGQISPAAADALFRKFHEGAAIINFTGHGSEQLWMAERVLDPERISGLKNRFRLPFLVTATCEFGRSDDPAIQSAAEQILFKKSSGAIGLVTSSRPVSSATNFDLNSDLYEALFKSNNQETPAAGELFRATKNARDSRIGNRNFILLGDPSMNLALPQTEIKITGIISSTGEKQIGGLDLVTISGEIQKNGTLYAGYEGEVSLELFDRPVSITTLGDENEPFGFDEWQRVLFRGTKSLKDGRFSFQFYTPARSQPADGKILIHANGANGFPDAGGAELPVKLLSVNFSRSDNTAPRLQLWMNDTTFVNGGPTSKDPILIAKLFDNGGIDLSEDPIRRITITLDDSVTYNGERYYSALNGNYLAGILSFQFFNLKQGSHQATLTVFDIGGNSTSQTISFNVEGDGIEVSLIRSFPNPFIAVTSVFLEHNRPGDDLAGTLVITDRLGSQIRKIDFEQPLAPGKVIIMDWDGTDNAGNKLPAGLYYLKAEVRSLLDGTKSSRSGKVILLN